MAGAAIRPFSGLIEELLGYENVALVEDSIYITTKEKKSEDCFYFHGELFHLCYCGKLSLFNRDFLADNERYMNEGLEGNFCQDMEIPKKEEIWDFRDVFYRVLKHCGFNTRGVKAIDEGKGNDDAETVKGYHKSLEKKLDESISRHLAGDGLLFAAGSAFKLKKASAGQILGHGKHINAGGNYYSIGDSISKMNLLSGLDRSHNGIIEGYVQFKKGLYGKLKEKGAGSSDDHPGFSFDELGIPIGCEFIEGSFFIYKKVEPFCLYEESNGRYYGFDEARAGVELKKEDGLYKLGDPLVINEYSHPSLAKINKPMQKICAGAGKDFLTELKAQLKQDQSQLVQQVSKILDYSVAMLESGYVGAGYGSAYHKLDSEFKQFQSNITEEPFRVTNKVMHNG